MSGPERSNLGARAGGYDFVVATTQASINAGLKQYLHKIEQPFTQVCIIKDSNGSLADITLDELKRLSGGVDPFDIPSGTGMGDSRIQALAAAKFAAGFQFQQGLPSSVMPKLAPDVIELGENASAMKFRLMCKTFEIVVLEESWQVFKQSDKIGGKSQKWLFESTVNIVRADLPRNLDTPYFDKHPEEKQKILNALNNLSDSAFSLQQLMFDLDSTVVQEYPEIIGIEEGSPAYEALVLYFKTYYIGTAKENGWPLLGVNAVAKGRDPSTLIMTAYERQVTSHTNPAYSTLDNVCMTGGHALPSSYAFDWNWVKDDGDIGSAPHGVLAINRRCLTQMFLKGVSDKTKYFCCLFRPYFVNRKEGRVFGGITSIPGAEPTFEEYDSGENLFKLTYNTYIKNVLDETDVVDAPSGGIASQALVVYLSLRGNTIIFTCITSYKIVAIKGGNEFNFEMFVTVVHPYSFTVDAAGTLLLKDEPVFSEIIHEYDPVEAVKFNILPSIIGLLPIAASIKAGIELSGKQFMDVQRAVFPGSSVFMFTNVRLSNYYDMICDLRYLALEESEASEHKGLLEQATGLKITHSSQLFETVKNLPSGHFEALQIDKDNGHALVFSIGSDNNLYAWEENSGLTLTGWKRHNLSLSTLQLHSAEQATAVLRTFRVGQSPLDGSIGMAIAIDAGGVDNLYLSLGNSSSNTSWLNSPQWIAVPFDGIPVEGGFRIANIMFAETAYDIQYLMVDIDTGISGHQIIRYHIDIDESEGKAWVKHDLPIDLDPGIYQSVVGRKSGEGVDGIYTAGRISGNPQLIYEPIVNIYGDTAPTPTRLSLPDGNLPNAIAAVRNTSTSSSLYECTDLYVVAGSTLYRYPADKQTTDAGGEIVLQDYIFTGAKSLYAMEFEDVVTLWVLRASGEVFYVSCYVDEINQPNSWSFPVTLLSDTEHISPYLNRTDGGNTIFAYTEDRLLAITQATATESKMWKTSYIQVEPTPKDEPEPCESFLSYSTTITLRDSNGVPVPDTMVSIQAESHTPAYVNGKYYILGWKETFVTTDSNGLVTVVQPTEGVEGEILHVSLPQSSETTVIDPMKKTFESFSNLDTTDGIRGATYPANEVMGGVVDDDRVLLVDPSTQDEDVKLAAQSMVYLKERYPQVQPSAKSSKLFYKARPSRVVRRGPGEKGATNFWNPFTAIGDLFRKAVKAVKKAVSVVWDAAKSAFKFVLEIGETVYNAVLVAVDAVVGAVVWLFNAIKTVVTAIIRFVKFLFQWKDIKRTKQVLHNVVKLYLTHQVDQIDTLRTNFRETLDGAADKLRVWGGITDWSSLGDTAKSPPDSTGEDPTKDHDSSSLLFANHYRAQSGKVQVKGALPNVTTAEAEDLIDILLRAISEEGEVLSTVYEDLQGLAADFTNLSVGEIIKRIASILGSAIVSSVGVVGDALFSVLSSLASSAFDLLDVKLHIPIISDILNAIGIPDISFLDLFCWIGAVGVTVVYKIVNGEAPFPNTAAVDNMISARSWSQLAEAFKGDRAMTADASRPSGDKEPLRNLTYWERVIHSVGHGFSGFVLFMNTFVSGAEALASSTKGANPMGPIAGVLGIVVAGSQGAAAYFAPRYPVEDKVVDGLSTMVTCITVLSGVTFAGPVQGLFAASSSRFKGLAVNDGRATGAIIKSILVFPALFVTGWHFYELSEKNAGAERSAAIIGEVTNLAAYTATISYSVAVNLPESALPAKIVAIGIMAGANITGGSLQTARASLPN
ncbi:gamma-glutamyltranspeptidase periplasmic precursor [Penicillium angulare]|uniref:Gamma-glutamyltranspeptidase periplasmic n=1 Tax=Penicillium angulare TaxID=116970 RepID=A0A9W9KBW7_9EURO|nr:gamma-glutamyltranspeptidase periplasmic precursor [Penicillium angulare]